MLRLVSDENFSGDIVRGLLLRHPALDLYRGQDVGLEGVDDPTMRRIIAERQWDKLT